MSFCDNLKEVREARGLSQPELAIAANVTQSAISQFETEKSNPSPKTIGLLAKALGVTTDRLIYGDERSEKK